MQPFTFSESSDDIGVINKLIKNSRAKIVAGGTNLLDLMKMYVETPGELIDINQLRLNGIEHTTSGGVKIGALVRNSDLAYHPTIIKNYKVLSEALLSGASPQLRNMATVGGNILQRTRCPYFFNTTFPCNKRLPGSGCPAISGYNRSHAILGTSDTCIATNPSDMCVAMAALDAIVIVHGIKGMRKIPFTDFHLLPGDTPEIETVLQHDEMIIAIELPPLSVNSKSHYVKVRDRASFQFALTSAAVVLDIDNGIIQSSRIAFGGIGTKPWRAFEAEQILKGAANNTQSYRNAADVALANAKPQKHNAFKIELAKRTLVRALENTGGIV